MLADMAPAPKLAPGDHHEIYLRFARDRIPMRVIAQAFGVSRQHVWTIIRDQQKIRSQFIDGAPTRVETLKK